MAERDLVGGKSGSLFVGRVLQGLVRVSTAAGSEA